jgi:UDP-3-O-[3-hydroxymyristoyl] N-acetylglucosamine deacetylase
MDTPMVEHTLAAPVGFSGIGLHTGEDAAMRILPAPPGTGIVFRRVDLDNFELQADVGSVERVAYATTLTSKGVWISTVEHVLSALYGLRIDNAVVELDNFEAPILDGSAAPYTEAIAGVGIAAQDAPRTWLRIVEPFEIEDRGKTLAIYPVQPNDGPAGRFSVEYWIDFPHPFIGAQHLGIDLTPESYAAAIAPARTFGFQKDVDALQAGGLVRGGSLDNAIVLTEDGMLNDTPLRFRDEFVRHKILDLLGDFSLIGHMVTGRLVANRAGHAMHTRFVAGLLAATDCWKLESLIPPPATEPGRRSGVRPAASRRA